LTGQRFGRLVVLRADGKKVFPSGQSRMQWLCKCDCGNEKVIDQAQLLSGNTKSCGCIVREFGDRYRKDLTGQRFGRLTVIEHAGTHKNPNGSRKTLWKCKCDCGNEIVAQGSNLLSGTTTSCGCYKIENSTDVLLIPMVGKRFGKLTVLERAENDRFHHVRYLCQCDCGGQTIVDSVLLRSGRTLSCGCLKSKGEQRINTWLVDHNISFRSNYSLDNIVFSTGRRPIFDFVIFDNDGNVILIIEFNGIQHYQATAGWNTEEQYQYNLKRDKEKRDLCAKHGYDLAIIPYTMIDDIDTAMTNINKIYKLCS